MRSCFFGTDAAYGCSTFVAAPVKAVEPNAEPALVGAVKAEVPKALGALPKEEVPNALAGAAAVVLLNAED